MRNSIVCRTACAVLVGLLISGAAAPNSFAQEKSARRTRLVEVVEKTQPCIVTVKVEKRNTKEVVGTGIVIDERGIVVTNRHVVAGADRVTVRMHDGTLINARIHLEAANHDLAVLKLNTEKRLRALRFGPASDLMVGESIIAIGNPYGYTNSVTTGIISALGRDITMPGNVVLKNLIQVNAPINPGNSGGPLFNIDGELIGIVVAIRDGAQGIAFALNSDSVQSVLTKLLSAREVANLEHGLVTRTEVLPEGETRQQVIVEAVASKSIAAKAGLKNGDVLTQLADLQIHNRFDIERALWNCKPGSKIQAVVLRDGEETQVAMTLGNEVAPRKTAVARAKTKNGASSHSNARPVRTNRVTN